jgi:hypothetical protein
MENSNTIALIAALATTLQLFITWFIAKEVKNYTTKTAKINNFMEIHRQWQEFNRLVITDQSFMAAYKSMEKDTASEDEIRLRYMIYFHLNFAHMLFHLGKNDAALRETFEPELRALIGFVKNNQEVIEQILTTERGYDENFINKAKEWLITHQT